jgi:tetratricopeptide (TPR) repeat protein
MEGNRDEAEKCILLAKKYQAVKNYEKALKFAMKSKQLYPTPGIDTLIARCRREGQERAKEAAKPAGPSAAAKEASARAFSNAPQNAGRKYTPEMAEVAARVKRCKDHYSTLGVAKSASDSDVKKAYRKLAMKLHPDKNTAPEAEASFKKVATAYQTLSDGDKRAHYDRYGEDDEGGGGGGGGNPFGGGRRRQRGAQYQEVDPDEIFRAFFGGGFEPMRQTQRRGQQQQQQQGGGRQQQEAGLPQLLQLLPILVLFLLTMLNPSSFVEESHAPFSMKRSPAHRVKRSTSTSHVVQNIPYFVAEDFNHKYAVRDRRYLNKVEASVEQHFKHGLKEKCKVRQHCVFVLVFVLPF